MTRFGKLALGAAVMGLVALSGTVTADDEKMAKLELKGGYTVVKGERDGEMISKEKFKDFVVRFTKDETIGTDKDKHEIYVAKYKLDSSRTPWKIMMTTVEKKKTDGSERKAGKDYAGDQTSTTGLIKKEGDTIVIIYALPGGKEPTEFKTKKGDKQQMFWLENKKK